MKKTLSLILSVILILSACVIPQVGFAAEGLSKTFSTADNADTLAGWKLPDGYVLSDADGITHGATLKKVIYKGGVFSGKFEYSVDFKLVYENPGRVITNYIDDSNYYYIELNPKKNDITFKTFRRGVVSTHGTYPLPYTIKANNLVTARVISNGGEGMSFYLKVADNAEATIFENVHVKDFIAEGTVGYDPQSNPLKVNNFKVTLLGDKDFVPPVEEEKPEETPEVPGDVTEPEEEEEDSAEKVYDERPLEVVTALGIMDAAALENGKATVTAAEFKEIIRNLKSEYTADEKITLGVATKEIIKVLGYDVVISSKNSYNLQANKLKLLRGIDLKSSDAITNYDMAMLIYNALEVDVLLPSSYGDKVTYNTVPGTTLLTYVLKMGKVEGQVSDNGVTALYTSSQVSQQYFVINNYKFLLYRDDVNRNDYIGRYVEAYYDDSDEDNKKILYIDYSKDEKVLVITPDMFVNYNGGVFTYYYNGNKTRTATFVLGNPVIYNGYHYNQSYNKNTFENINHGSITLVSNGSNTYSTMIIKDYESIYVSGIVDRQFCVYDKAHDSDSSTYIYDFEFPLDDNASNSSYVPIYDAEGNKIEFADITVGSVVSIAKANVPHVAEMIVANESIPDFAINEMYNEDGFTVLSDFEETFKVNREYANAIDAKTFKLGHVATLYLDAFGYVTWADFTGEQELYVGVLVDSELTTGIAGGLDIAIYETDGEQQIFQTAKKIRFKDVDGSEDTLTRAQLAAKIKPGGVSLNEIVAYTLDDNDLITSFELPLDTYDINADNHCTKIHSASSEIKFSYKNISKSFDYKYYIGTGAKLFAVPSDKKTDLEEYRLESIGYDKEDIDSASNSLMSFYSIDGDNIIDYAIMYDFAGVSTGMSASKKDMIVTGTSMVYDEESGLNLYKIQGYVTSGVTIYAEPSVFNNARSVMTDSDTTPNIYSVQKGDIIKYSVDEKTGRVDDIVIIYRNNITSPTLSKGWILDADGGKYTETNTKSNPFSLSYTNNKFTISDGNTNRKAGGRRYIYGWVYDNRDGVLEITTQDLSASATYWNESGGLDATHSTYISEFHRASIYTMASVTFLNDKEGTVEVKAGSASDIKTFKQVGRNCSRVLIMLHLNEQANFNMIILNDK